MYSSSRPWREDRLKGMSVIAQSVDGLGVVERRRSAGASLENLPVEVGSASTEPAKGALPMERGVARTGGQPPNEEPNERRVTGRNNTSTQRFSATTRQLLPKGMLRPRSRHRNSARQIGSVRPR